jgi:vacuole morphology and inheritance protein 14
MATDALSIIPSAVLRNLSDKLYEKRKNAALEVRGPRLVPCEASVS